MASQWVGPEVVDGLPPLLGVQPRVPGGRGAGARGEARAARARAHGTRGEGVRCTII